jgi:hypothetical protein
VQVVFEAHLRVRTMKLDRVKSIQAESLLFGPAKPCVKEGD